MSVMPAVLPRWYLPPMEKPHWTGGTQSVPLSTKPVSHWQPSCWADVGQGGLSAGAGTRGAAELVVAVGRADQLWRKTDES